jgi:hypothetical protein
VTQKSQFLVRDLAKLIAKYDLEDWQPILAGIKNGFPEYTFLAHAVQDLLKKKPKESKTNSKDEVERFLANSINAPARKTQALMQIYADLKQTRTAPSTKQLQQVLTQFGIKSPPKKRQEALIQLFKMMLETSDDRFEELVRDFPRANVRNLEDEYNRWVRLIYSQGTSRK